ncbi:MAG: CorA family divalent cation transporter [Candidatus Saccharimonas sp.]
MTQLADTAIWQDVVVAGPAAWQKVGSELGLSQLHTRLLTPKRYHTQVIEVEGWLLVNFLLPAIRRDNLLTTRLTVLLSKTKIITIHEGELDEQITARIEHRSQGSGSPTGILGIIADVVTERYGPILDHIDNGIDNLEDAIIVRATDEQLQELFTHKRLVADLRRLILPTSAVLNALCDGRFDVIEKKYVPYLRDSYDYAWRTHEMIDSLRDLLTSGMDMYLSVVSNRLNEVMKRLTIVATIFMPISFLVGFGGMNFTHMPFSSEVAYMGILALIILTPLSMLTYFKLKKWF